MRRHAAAAIAAVVAGALVAAIPGAPVARAAEGLRFRTLPAIMTDGKGIGLRRPESVAFDGTSRLAVADTGNGRILLYTVEGDKATPGPEIRVAEASYPLLVRFAPQGALLVLDGKSKKIARLSPSGEFKGYVAGQEDAVRGAILPRSLRVGADGALYLLDIAQGSVVVLGPDEKVQRRIASPADARGLSDIEVDARGVVYALESVGRRLLVARPEDAAFKPLASLAEETAFPTSMAIDAGGRIAIADQGSGGIVFYAGDGTFRGRQAGMGWKDGLLRAPSGIAFGPAGMLFVADRSNNRIATFGLQP